MNARVRSLVLGSLVAAGLCGCKLPLRSTSVGGLDLYSVRGTVTGLARSGLQLQNNGVDTINISADGQFIFRLELTKGSAYFVSVLTSESTL